MKGKTMDIEKEHKTAQEELKSLEVWLKNAQHVTQRIIYLKGRLSVLETLVGQVKEQPGIPEVDQKQRVEDSSS